MIENEQIAEEINQLMLDSSAKLDRSLARVQEHCSLQEFEVYRDAVGKVMGYMYFEIMSPLYKTHPNLKPEGMD